MVTRAASEGWVEASSPCEQLETGREILSPYQQIERDERVDGKERLRGNMAIVVSSECRISLNHPKEPPPLELPVGP